MSTTTLAPTARTTASYGVHSEVGVLRKVLVCAPGLAHSRLTPRNCDDLLFDDVLWVDNARRDHADFVEQMRAGESPVVLHLLDWLSLVLPQWRLGRREGAAFLAISAFALTSLAIMGIGYALELALAAFLLLLPWAVLFWMRVALARGLAPLLAQAEGGNEPLSLIAAEVVRRMTLHRRLVTALSMAAVAVAALWGALWSVVHPYGF